MSAGSIRLNKVYVNQKMVLWFTMATRAVHGAAQNHRYLEGGRIFTFVPAGCIRGLVTWSTILTSMHLGFDQDPGSDKEALTFP
jgi:hypothetical protein